MILLIMIRYYFSWRGLVSTSTHIFSVGKYYTVISPLLITYFTKKYLTLMCLVLFIIRRMVMWLSWNSMLISTAYPLPLIKYCVHNTSLIISLTPMSLLSVKLRPLIFCFHEPLAMAPDPRDITPQVCPWQ